jgi:type IV pilus assembly protein PilC
MRLAYTAYDGSGKTVTGVVEATDTTTGMDVLRKKGLYVAEIVAAATGVHPKSVRTSRKRRLSGNQRLKNVAWFSRQLHVLVSSGTQLADALHALERQTRPGPWQKIIVGLRARVEEGNSLSTAMESYGDCFDPIYRSLICAGESSGHLLEMLDRLASLKQKQLRVRNSVVGAMIYPCMLTTVGTGIFAMLLIFVIPRFSGLFKTLDVPLPASTQALMTISNIFRGYWWLVLLVTAGLITAIVSYLRTPEGKALRDKMVLRVPYIGRVIRSFSTARIVSLLGVLMQARIPVLEALRLVRLSAGNVRYEEIVSKAQDFVSRGEPMSTAFADGSLISPSVHEAIRSGEESGELDRLLLNIASFLDEENEVIIRSLTSIIEPVILILMGILVGVVSICMFLPLFDLTAMTQGGGAG